MAFNPTSVFEGEEDIALDTPIDIWLIGLRTILKARFDRRAEKTIASKATMMDPTELNDPAMAEAFLREAIDDLAAHIARTEAYAEKKIQGYRESTPDNPELLLRLTSSVQEGLHAQTEPLRQHLAAMREVVERAETIRKQIEDIGPLPK